MTSPLDRLAERVQHDLELTDYPRREWLQPRLTAEGARVYDVVIVGGGQGGLSAAFGLMRERITNILVVDENPLDGAVRGCASRGCALCARPSMSRGRTSAFRA